MQDKDQLFEVLLKKYFAKEISCNDRELLFSMIMESVHYKELYEATAKLKTYQHVTSMESRKGEKYNELIKRIDTEPKSKKLWFVLGRVAAVVVLVISTSIGSVYLYKTYIDKTGTDEIAMLETSTPLGGESKILLPDGSVAWLNAKSELKYSISFGKNDRKLYLSGEAYFEVSKNKELPFIVSTEDMEVTATGTVFNVRAYLEDDQTEVQLIEGGVDVLAAKQVYHLKPNEKVVYVKTTQKAMKLGEKEVYDKIAKKVVEGQNETHDPTQWTQGKLSFDRASLSEIIKDIERKFNVTIRIESEQLKSEYFMGTINMDLSLDDVLRFIDVDKKYEIERQGDTIVIRDKK